MIARIAFLAVILLAAPVQAQRLEGRVTVSDGDTIAIEGVRERIRLYGIDAPESGQTCDDARGQRYLCGTRSAEYLAQLVGRSGRLTCFEEDRDRYGRLLVEHSDKFAFDHAICRTRHRMARADGRAGGSVTTLARWPSQAKRRKLMDAKASYLTPAAENMVKLRA